MINDDKHKSLALPANLVDPEHTERGAADDSSSVRRAIDEAGQRAIGASVALESVDASERRSLIGEIRLMRRVKSNVAIHAGLTGAKVAAVCWIAYKVFKSAKPKAV